jgi:hypothetical protein
VPLTAANPLLGHTSSDLRATKRGEKGKGADPWRRSGRRKGIPWRRTHREELQVGEITQTFFM